MLHHSVSKRIYAYIFGIIFLTLTAHTSAEPNNVKHKRTNDSVAAGPAVCDEFVGPDFNHDCYVDMNDYRLFQLCVTGPDAGQPSVGCEDKDLDGDDDVDESDFTFVPQCTSGPEYLADATCENPD